MGGGQRMNWVKDPNSHFSKLDMGGEGCVDNRRMERGRCEADFLMKFQADRRRGGGKNNILRYLFCPGLREVCRDDAQPAPGQGWYHTRRWFWI